MKIHLFELILSNNISLLLFHRILETTIYATNPPPNPSLLKIHLSNPISLAGTASIIPRPLNLRWNTVRYPRYTPSATHLTKWPSSRKTPPLRAIGYKRWEARYRSSNFPDNPRSFHKRRFSTPILTKAQQVSAIRFLFRVTRFQKCEGRAQKREDRYTRHRSTLPVGKGGATGKLW